MTKEQAERKARFKTIISELDIDRQRLAENLGFSKGYIDQILSADKNVSDSLLFKFTRLYKMVNEDWLLNGTGDKFRISNLEVKQANEPHAIYGKGRTDPEPFELLRIWKESFEARIKHLEAEMERVKARLPKEEI